MSTRIRVFAACAASVVAVALGAAAPASATPARTEAQAQRVVVKATPAQVADMARVAAAQKVAIANDSHGCSGTEVSDNTYVHVCYVRDGDTIWVHDDQANGYTAVGQIYFYDSAGPGGAGYYYGYCFDRYSSSGPWDHCGFPEADEGRTVQYRGYDTKGSVTAHFTAWQSESSS